MKIILAAEDDEPIRKILRDALGEVPGWTVTAVPTGSELLEMLGSVLPDLVLLDVNLPGVDGIEVYRMLREREGMADMSVLFVTAQPERVRDADLDGNFAVLPKPFGIDDLFARVAGMLGEPKPDI